MRSYGQKFLIQLRDADPTRLGVRLGRICVDANLPANRVAKVLDVSKTTVYAWFRGQMVMEDNAKVVEAFINLVQRDMDAGILPAKNAAEARTYLNEMVGGSG